MNYFKRLRDSFIAILLMVIPFLFLRANLKDMSQTTWLDKRILEISAPLQFVATQLAHTVSAWVGDYLYLTEVNKENQRLATQNRQLKQSLRQMRSHLRENQRLRQLLELRRRIDYKSLSAQVVAKEVSPFFRVVRIRLDRGQHEGLRAGMPVVSAQGLVGQVQRPAGRYCDVLLVVDRASAIDVIIPRTGARGILRGTGESNRYLARMQYLRRDDRLEVGDEVYTSGFGKRFPGSILVGRVTRITHRDYGLYQQAEVEPTVNFSQLREVIVLDPQNPQQKRHQDDARFSAE